LRPQKDDPQHGKELFMSGKPAARVTDPTACPLPGHGTNPIANGSPNVNFDGLVKSGLSPLALH
jgi:uncharacterized Zn-binding protein involved in type VI secretion